MGNHEAAHVIAAGREAAGRCDADIFIAVGLGDAGLIAFGHVRLQAGG